MKNLQLTFLLFCGIMFLKTQNSLAQNLQFNQAIFNTYGPGNADGNLTTPLFIGTLVVGANQILKITSSSVFSANAIANTVNSAFWATITINDCGIGINASPITETWLPTGTYTIKATESGTVYTSGSYKGMISGILYDIVP